MMGIRPVLGQEILFRKIVRARHIKQNEGFIVRSIS